MFTTNFGTFQSSKGPFQVDTKNRSSPTVAAARLRTKSDPERMKSARICIDPWPMFENAGNICIEWRTVNPIIVRIAADRSVEDLLSLRTSNNRIIKSLLTKTLASSLLPEQHTFSR
eukprot:1106667_1